MTDLSDPPFPDNPGPWLVPAPAGLVTGAPAPAAAPSSARALPIGLCSALYTGFATVGDALIMADIAAEAALVLPRAYRTC